MAETIAVEKWEIVVGDDGSTVQIRFAGGPTLEFDEEMFFKFQDSLYEVYQTDLGPWGRDAAAYMTERSKKFLDMLPESYRLEDGLHDRLIAGRRKITLKEGDRVKVDFGSEFSSFLGEYVTVSKREHWVSGMHFVNLERDVIPFVTETNYEIKRDHLAVVRHLKPEDVGAQVKILPWPGCITGRAHPESKDAKVYGGLTNRFGTIASLTEDGATVYLTGDTAEKTLPFFWYDLEVLGPPVEEGSVRRGSFPAFDPTIIAVAMTKDDEDSDEA